MKFNFIGRSRIISLFFIICSLVFSWRLFSVQVVKSEYYRNQAERQYITPAQGVFERKTIFLEKKDGVLMTSASQMSGFKLEINPTRIKNKENVYNELSKIVEINKDDFFVKAGKVGDPSEDLLKKVKKEDADRITKLKLDGVLLPREKWRFYPGNNLASHVIGFSGYSGDNIVGLYGIEKYYNDILSKNEDMPHLNFFAEVFTNIKKDLFEKETKKGDLVLTIEPMVQSILEKELKSVKEKYEVDSVGGIIMNPKNGEIYAMAVKPDFDLNNFFKEKDSKIFNNPIVENIFEFGSIVKPLVVASAINENLINSETKYNDNGSVVVDKKVISNFDKKGRGEGTTIQTVLSQSLNTGMVFIYQKLGKERFRDYLFSFGLKEKTGIDLPGETNSLVNNLNSPRELEYANASFGQGLAFTPIQMIRSLGILANQGNLVTPHLLKKIKYENGEEEIINYTAKPSKVNKDSVDKTTEMLVNIVDKSLRSGSLKLEHYSVAAKTGTAQVANINEGGYYKDRNMHSFFGYFPAYDPKFIILLYAMNPKGTPYASVTWPDAFFNITKYLLNYYSVPPDR